MTDRLTLRVYIGYDAREEIAFEVCRHSILARASVPVEVVALRQDELRAGGLYWRAPDEKASTDFSLTRFLVPALEARRRAETGEKGAAHAVFCDCDFLFNADIGELLGAAGARKRTDPARFVCDGEPYRWQEGWPEESYAVHVVQHDHRPQETVKMDGRVQHGYARKNWSSLIVWNCAHPANLALDPELVNRLSPGALHRFAWLGDSQIGGLAEGWNWLAGVSPTLPARAAAGQPGAQPFAAEYTPAAAGKASVAVRRINAVHYTLGGPWFADAPRTAFDDWWRAERAAMERAGGGAVGAAGAA